MYEFSKTIFPLLLANLGYDETIFGPNRVLHERVKQLSPLRPLFARNSFKIYADDMTCLEEVTYGSLI